MSLVRVVADFGRNVVDSVGNFLNLISDSIVGIIRFLLGDDEIIRREPEHHPLPNDGEMSANVRELLVEHFGQDPVSSYQALSMYEKTQFIEEFTKAVANLMNIRINGVVIEEMGGSICGFFNPNDESIHLNLAYLSESLDRTGVVDLFDTIIHELRHCFQYSAVVSPDEYGVDPETAQNWAYNFLNYVRDTDDPYRYANQILEVDARNFAAMVLENIK